MKQAKLKPTKTGEIKLWFQMVACYADKEQNSYG